MGETEEGGGEKKREWGEKVYLYFFRQQVLFINKLNCVNDNKNLFLYQM